MASIYRTNRQLGIKSHIKNHVSNAIQTLSFVKIETL